MNDQSNNVNDVDKGTHKDTWGDLSIDPPAQLISLDSHAAQRWPVFLNKAGLKMTREGWNDPHRAYIVAAFGVPSLIKRLSGVKAETERARVWWRESAACSAGDAIPDLSDANRYLLNPFIVEGPKFHNARVEAMKSAKVGSILKAAGERTCLSCGADISALRAGARYCGSACKKTVQRQSSKSPTAQIAA